MEKVEPTTHKAPSAVIRPKAVQYTSVVFPRELENQMGNLALNNCEATCRPSCSRTGEKCSSELVMDFDIDDVFLRDVLLDNPVDAGFLSGSSAGDRIQLNELKLQKLRSFLN